jgi:hypothetical protein
MNSRDDSRHDSTGDRIKQWLMGLGGVALVAVLTGLYSNSNEQARQQAALSVQMAVANTQLVALNSQLAAVPEMQRQIAVNVAALARDRDDISALKAQRGR